METRQVSTWSEIVELVQGIQRQYSKVVSGGYELKNHVLFRGLANNNWELRTTLERESNKSCTVRSYCELIYRCAPQIESFLGTSRDLGTFEELEKELTEKFDDIFAKIPKYDYWVYLRHHGFPSPLLDWSESPYVALFFALCEQSDAEYSSLYVYVEMPSGSKGWIGSQPRITVLYPYVRTDKRHFLQQSYYTVSTEIHEGYRKEHRFVPHEQVFQMNENDQDFLWKIVFPRSFRREAPAILSEYNINHFSLFQTEDSLIKALAMKELELSLSELSEAQKDG
jgi:hypothetical protein